jgi:hypothetical protein
MDYGEREKYENRNSKFEKGQNTTDILILEFGI